MMEINKEIQFRQMKLLVLSFLIISGGGNRNSVEDKSVDENFEFEIMNLVISPC